MIGMKVPGGRKPPLPKEKNKKEYFSRHSPDLDTKDTSTVTHYQATLDDNIPLFDQHPSPEVAGDQLLQISFMSSETVRKISPPAKTKPRSSFKDGWSPTMVALKYHHIDMLLVLENKEYGLISSNKTRQ